MQLESDFSVRLVFHVPCAETKNARAGAGAKNAERDVFWGRTERAGGEFYFHFAVVLASLLCDLNAQTNHLPGWSSISSTLSAYICMATGCQSTLSPRWTRTRVPSANSRAGRMARVFALRSPINNKKDFAPVKHACCGGEVCVSAMSRRAPNAAQTNDAWITRHWIYHQCSGGGAYTTERMLAFIENWGDGYFSASIKNVIHRMHLKKWCWF